MALKLAIACQLGLSGCGVEPPAAPTDETQEIVSNLVEAGFPVNDIQISDGVVYVGRDAAVTLQASRELRLAARPHAATTRQYRTTNLLGNGVTTICVNGAAFSGAFSAALDEAIANYNHLGLRFNMVRTNGDPSACSATITAVIAPGVTGGSSGFPSGGLPFGTINIGDGLTPFATSTITHVITHEIGHTLGFRHSDFFNRSISCGIGGNEGDAGVGAILVDGTPSTATVGGSIMNSCFRQVEAGEFTSTDITALQGLYPPLVPPRIGVLSGGHFFVKEGGLSAAWVDEFGDATAGLLSGNRIGVISGGHLFVKEGGLSAAWVDEFSNVTAAALAGDRIGALSSGHFFVKEGGLSAAWVDESGDVTGGMLSGKRIGVISGGHLFVKEGGLSAAWVDEFSNVTAAALAGDRIGALSSGHFFVKEGGLSAAWVDEFGDVTAGMLSGNRIGVISGGHLFVKEGGLSAAWVDEFANVTAAALSGNRIGVLSGGHWFVKEGGLSTAWVDERGDVVAGALPSN